MKKTVILTVFMAVTAVTASAQWKLRYQGEAQAGYTFGIGNSYDRVNVHVLNGVRFGEYMFAGVGAGADIFLDADYGNVSSDELNYGTKAKIAVPVYLAVRGYLPVARRLDISAGVDAGRSIQVSKKDDMGVILNGFMLVPQIGMSYKLYGGNAVTLNCGFVMQDIKRRDLNSKSSRANGITLRLGYQF